MKSHIRLKQPKIVKVTFTLKALKSKLFEDGILNLILLFFIENKS